MALIMEGVDSEFDIVVVGRSNGFASRKVRTDGVRIRVPTHPDNIEVRRVVGQIDVRRLRSRLSIRRLLLGEAADLAKLACRTVRFHVLKVFQSRRCVDAGYLRVAGWSCKEWCQSR